MYVGLRDRPLEERQMRFAAGCREGHTEIVSFDIQCNVKLLSLS